MGLYDPNVVVWGQVYPRARAVLDDDAVLGTFLERELPLDVVDKGVSVLGVM